MDPFLSFLEKRRAKLKRQQERIERALTEVDKSERLYRASGAVPAPGVVPRRRLANQQQPLFEEDHPARATIKQRVVRILEANPQGLTSGALLTILQTNGLPDLLRESLSPQLSRLKKDSVNPIVSENGVWKLKKHESPGG